MGNIKYYLVSTGIRYTLQLSPSFNVETSNLAEMLKFLYEYGGNDE